MNKIRGSIHRNRIWFLLILILIVAKELASPSILSSFHIVSGKYPGDVLRDANLVAYAMGAALEYITEQGAFFLRSRGGSR